MITSSFIDFDFNFVRTSLNVNYALQLMLLKGQYPPRENGRNS